MSRIKDFFLEFKEDKKKLMMIGGIIVFFVFAGAWIYFYFFTASVELVVCPATCDDNKTCTSEICDESTNYTCAYTLVVPCANNQVCEENEPEESADCPACDDQNVCSLDWFDYPRQECLHQVYFCEKLKKCNLTYAKDIENCPICNDGNACTRDKFNFNLQRCEYGDIENCCGNSRCEEKEDFYSCPLDCMQTKEQKFAECVTDDYCKKAVAIEFKDEKICKEVLYKGTRDECYFNVALLVNTTDACHKINSDTKKVECIILTAESKADPKISIH